MVRRILILTASLFAVGAGTALAVTPPTWNSGYNGWWPGGFGYAPVTVQALGYPASVTAYGPTFRSTSSGWTMAYGGGTSVVRGLGVKTLTMSVQVLGPDGRTWYTITGSNSTGGPISGNPLRMAKSRPGYLGHVYRTVVTTKLVVPNGHAGCSLNNTCDQTIIITAISRPLAP
jgi:hypothetical protein